MTISAHRRPVHPEEEPDHEKETPLIAPGDDTEGPEDIEGNNDVRDPAPEKIPA